ncbi:MAG TPA: toprim domain-containing protein [Anaerolineales bacterium]|nr:toprim domain-containing protein [Anaerolineales bacterium]
MDAQTLNRSYDLLSLVERDSTLRKSGGWYIGPCPLCGGVDRFNLKQTGEGWRWYCRGCGDGKYHTPIDFVMARERVDFRGALAWLGGGAPQVYHAPAVSTPQRRDDPIPPAPWQGRGAAYVNQCASFLWGSAGAAALAWLHGRGLSDDTIHAARLGYNPGGYYDAPGAWGMAEKVWLARGITIPCIFENELYYIKTRQLSGDPKYIKVEGSKPGIFGGDDLRGRRLAVFCEGELDALLLHQAAGDLAAVATLGSATDDAAALDMALWGECFIWPGVIFAVYDNDPPGIKGARKLAAFSRRVKVVSLPELPGVKDITDYHLAGGDLRAWLARTLEELECR